MRSRTKKLFILTLLSLSITAGLIWLLSPKEGSYATAGWTSGTVKIFTVILLPYLLLNYFNLRALTGLRWTWLVSRVPGFGWLQLFSGQRSAEDGVKDRILPDPKNKSMRHAVVPSFLLCAFGLSSSMYLFFYQSAFVSGIVAASVFVFMLLVIMFITPSERKKLAEIKKMTAAEKTPGG